MAVVVFATRVDYPFYVFWMFWARFQKYEKVFVFIQRLITFATALREKLKSKKRPEKGLKKTFKKSRKGFGNKKQNTTFATASKEKLKSKKET